MLNDRTLICMLFAFLNTNIIYSSIFSPLSSLDEFDQKCAQNFLQKFKSCSKSTCSAREKSRSSRIKIHGMSHGTCIVTYFAKSTYQWIPDIKSTCKLPKYLLPKIYENYQSNLRKHRRLLRHEYRNGHTCRLTFNKNKKDKFIKHLALEFSQNSNVPKNTASARF